MSEKETPNMTALLPIPHPYWIETWSGEAFDLMHPDPARMHIEDVAVHLSLLNRFIGATGEGYSVAQHCVHVAELLPPELKRRGLFHDVEETWLGDQSAPWKRMIKVQHPNTASVHQFYVELIRKAAAKAFRVEYPFSIEPVWLADLVMLSAEVRDFMHNRRPPNQPWNQGTLRDCSHVPKLTAWPAAEARARFLEMYEATGLING